MAFILKNCKLYLGLLIGLSVAAACSKDEFKVKGEIYGGEEKMLVMERSNFQGDWVPVDSTRINRNGGFSISFPAPKSPEIFRLVLNGKYIYFPIDSKETLTVNTSLDKFGHDFSLEGTPDASRMAEFEQELQKAPIGVPDSMAQFKRSVYTKYMKELPGSIVSFYILTKTIDDKPLYNPSDATDRKYFAAVATGFKTMRPDAPQTALLEQTALKALQEKNREEGKFSSIEAEEIALIDIDLPDENGKNIKLSDLAGKGKPVIVVFSLLNHPDSPDFNFALGEFYNSHKGTVEIYNVSLDADQYEWREAARNLPWITVYSPGQTGSQDALRYNVFQIPSFYIYNANGEISSRPMTLDELRKSL
ncbi:MAG: DUF4369 domain-containing protein [Muribaculaceae bacterium]|nr:DUF4369 domain-containing protein [Muribaculaceae bacterium]